MGSLSMGGSGYVSHGANEGPLSNKHAAAERSVKCKIIPTVGLSIYRSKSRHWFASYSGRNNKLATCAVLEGRHPDAPQKARIKRVEARERCAASAVKHLNMRSSARSRSRDDV